MSSNWTPIDNCAAFQPGSLRSIHSSSVRYDALGELLFRQWEPKVSHQKISSIAVEFRGELMNIVNQP
jgi:hypothetical protein